MGQEDRRHACEELGFVALAPEHLGRRVARRQCQLGGLGRRLCVAPEFGRAQGARLAIEQDTAVLLAGDGQGTDGGAVHLFQDTRQNIQHRRRPGFRVLLRRSRREIRQQSVGLAGAGHDALLFKIPDQGLGALGAHIQADGKGSGGHQPRAPSRCSTANWSRRS